MHSYSFIVARVDRIVILIELPWNSYNVSFMDNLKMSLRHLRD